MRWGRPFSGPPFILLSPDSRGGPGTSSPVFPTNSSFRSGLGPNPQPQGSAPEAPLNLGGWSLSYTRVPVQGRGPLRLPGARTPPRPHALRPASCRTRPSPDPREQAGEWGNPMPGSERPMAARTASAGSPGPGGSGGAGRCKPGLRAPPGPPAPVPRRAPPLRASQPWAHGQKPGRPGLPGDRGPWSQKHPLPRGPPDVQAPSVRFSCWNVPLGDGPPG